MIKDLFKTITISLITLSLVGITHAWTEPTSNPPASNVKAPITVSSDTQYKSGLFSTEYLRSYGTTLLATDNGNVGIGTTGPGNKLDVNGGINAQAFNSDSGNFIVGPAGGSARIWTRNTTPLSFLVNDGEIMRMTSNGNVGIGTTAPDTKLRVKPASASDGISIEGFNTAANRGFFGLNSSGGGLAYLLDSSGNQNVQIDSQGVSYFNGGNVGIGTTAPQTKLHILNGTDNMSGLSIGNAGMTEGLKIWSNATSKASYIDSMYNADYGDIFFRTKLSSTPINAMVIKGNGNVGIGTTEPGAKLEVAGQVKITGGTPGANKVLTSDATGLASWTTPASAPVTSVFGRTGAVTSASGDYSVSQVTGAAPTASPIFTGLVKVLLSNPKNINTPLRNIFQIASNEVSDPLTLKMGIKTDATDTNRYAGIEVDDAGTKRNLILQPDGGNIGIGTGSTAPASKLEIKSTSDEMLRLTRSSGTYPTIFNQGIDNSLYITNGNKNTLSINAGNVKFYEKVTLPDNRNISASDPRLDIQGVVKITQPSNSYSTSETNLDLQGPIHIQYPWYGVKLGTSNATYGGGSYAISVGNIDSVSPSAQDDLSILYWTENGVAKNIDRFVIRNNGDIGIGTKSPKATLDINGYAKLKPQTSAPVACSATYKGSIAYASANNKLCVCNGTSWVYEGGALNCGW